MDKAILVMDMPKGCITCRFKNVENNICYLNNMNIDSNNEYRPDCCPLKALPKPIDVSGCKTDITKARAQEYNSLLAKLIN